MCNLNDVKVGDGHVTARIMMAPGCVTTESPANFIAAVKAEFSGWWFELGEGLFTATSDDNGGPTLYTVKIGATTLTTAPVRREALSVREHAINIERRFNARAAEFPAPRADVFVRDAF